MTDLIGAETLPSVVKDPFLKDAIKSINIEYCKKMFADKMIWTAKVRMANGNTSGTQETPECDTFEDVVRELKTIFASLK